MATTPNSLITPQRANVPPTNCLLSTAMTSTKAFDGTEAVGTAMQLIHTVGTNDGQLPPLRIKYSGTNGAAPSGLTTATTVRVFFNNGTGANTTAANNIYYTDIPVAAVTMGTTAALADLLYDFRKLVLPAGWKVYAGLVTAIGGTNCALAVSMPGGGDH